VRLVDLEQADGSTDGACLAWRRRYRVLWLGLVVLAAVVAGRFWSQRVYVAEPFALERMVTDELEDRVNPNEASAASLSRLPGIGLKKAQAVVEYRERCRAEQGDETLPFRCCDDLTQVKGIGPATAERMRPYLRFER